MKTISNSAVLFVAAIGSFSVITGMNYITAHTKDSRAIESATMPESFVRDASAISLTPVKTVHTERPIIYEFFDYQCPACRSAETSLKGASALDGKPMDVVRLHFPLRQHLAAPLASRAAFAASKQAAFEGLHARLMTERDLSRAAILGYAKSMHLDMKRFVADLDSSQATRFIGDSIELANKYRIEATPSYFLQRADGRCIRVTNLQQAFILARQG